MGWPVSSDLIMTFEEGDPNENPWVCTDKEPQADIKIEPYSEKWPKLFLHYKDLIQRELPDVALSIDHVGSTSVEGLSAKPVIDMDLIVADPEDEYGYVHPLERSGFYLRIRERSWYQHRMLKHEHPEVNLHVFPPNSPAYIRHILFREWLKGHPEDRELYVMSKLEALPGATRVMEYNQRKEEVIRQIYQKIFKAQGWL